MKPSDRLIRDFNEVLPDEVDAQKEAQKEPEEYYDEEDDEKEEEEEKDSEEEENIENGEAPPEGDLAETNGQIEQ